MKTLLAPTNDIIKVERTKLDQDVTAGTDKTLVLLDNDGMAEDTYIVVGQEGAEKAEIALISAEVTPGSNVTVASLVFEHKKGEPVTVYRFNRRKFYGSATKDGIYTELTGDGSPVKIQVDDPQGTRLEYTGSEYSYFKATYYHEETNVETPLADAEEVLVLEADSKRYATLYGIRKMAGFTQNPYITDGRIEDKRKQAENEINSAIMQRYILPLPEVPPLITYICECLAAGYMHYEEYGPEGDAVKKLGEARALLKAIGNGTQRLIGENLQELPISRSAAGLYGKPDGSETGGDRRKFRLNQKF